jgi:hypothetical protein
MDKEQQEAFDALPVSVVDPGDYTLRIVGVQLAEDELSLRPYCIVVDGNLGGTKVCPETYDFHEGGQNAEAIRNLYAWGVTEQEMLDTAGNVRSIGGLLEGRLGRVALTQRSGPDGEMVNAHAPGAVTALEQ